MRCVDVIRSSTPFLGHTRQSTLPFCQHSACWVDPDSIPGNGNQHEMWMSIHICGVLPDYPLWHRGWIKVLRERKNCVINSRCKEVAHEQSASSTVVDNIRDQVGDDQLPEDNVLVSNVSGTIFTRVPCIKDKEFSQTTMCRLSVYLACESWFSVVFNRDP